MPNPYLVEKMVEHLDALPEDTANDLCQLMQQVSDDLSETIKAFDSTSPFWTRKKMQSVVDSIAPLTFNAE